jgi:hypothetical protein
MRIWGLIGFIAAMALGSSVHAAAVCSSGCTTDATGVVFLGANYTVPTTGGLIRWDLWSDAAHPNVLISVASPNDVFGVEKISNGAGGFSSQGYVPTFQWTETQLPGHTIIIASAPAPYDNCSGVIASGVVCGVQGYVWGDNAGVSVNVQDVVRLVGVESVVPEPTTWLLMLSGLFGLGLALRRARAARMGRPATA